MNKEDYKDYIVDQLRELDNIRVKPMFSSFGLYLDEKFFAILSKNRLYFKTNEKTRAKYEEYGMRPFRASKKQILKNYFEVPGDIVENISELKDWALEASLI